MKSMSIRTLRLLLRTIERKDAEVIVRLRNQDDIYKYYKNPYQITVEKHLQWYGNVYLDDEARYDFVITLLENSDRIIGTCGISNLNMERKSMEISYLLDADFQKMGYATEAVMALIDMAGREWGIKEISAIIHQDNIPSVCFAKNLGFTWKCTKEAFSEYVLRRKV